MKSAGTRLFAFVLAIYLLFAPGHLHNQDAGHQLGVAASMVHEGSFESHFGGRFEAVGREGKRYAEYPIGQSLLYVPAVVAGDLAPRIHPARPSGEYAAFFASFVSPIVSALGVLAFFVLAGSLGTPTRAALGLSLVYAFATIQWPYAHDSFDISTATTLLVWALVGILRGRRSGRILPVALSGVALGCAILVRLPALLAVPFAALYLVSGRLRLDGAAFRRLAAFLFPIAASGLVVLWYNWVRFGDPFQTGYEENIQFWGSFWEGFAGPLVSPGKSLFLYSPPLVAALFWYPAFLRTRGREAFLFLVIVLANLLFHARLTFWSGDWAWGPRYMVPATPLLLAPLAIPFARWRETGRFARGSVILAIAMGLAVQILGVAIDYQVQLSLLLDRGEWTNRVWSPRSSPLVWQAKMTLEVAKGTAPIPRDRARRPDDGGLRANTFDFWWVHLWHLGVSKAAVVLSVLALFGIATVAAWRLRRAIPPPSPSS